MATPRTIVIMQSNYIPWKGYFDLMARADEFILLDDVQYTRRDWRNRNRLKSPDGPKWLTIPVRVRDIRHQTIDQTAIADPAWGRRHWASISTWYRKAPFFDDFSPLLEELYLGVIDTRLSYVNRRFLETLSMILNIDTRLSWSTDYPSSGTKGDRILSLCQAAGAECYLSGPAARAYLDEEQFARAGVRVEWMSYENYPTYRQLYPPFRHDVSVLDLILNVGSDASQYMLGAP